MERHKEVIAAHDAVLDCAVAGVPHEFLGEVPVAFVIARPGCEVTAKMITDHCHLHLSNYKVPHAVHIVADIPRTRTGKVQRFKLKELGNSV